MKQRMAVAGLAAGLATSCWLSPAKAGEWVDVTESQPRSEWVEGTVGYSITASPSNIEHSYPWADDEWMAGFGPWNWMYVQEPGGPISSYSNGQRRSLFQWQPNIDWNTGLPDLNDTPPELLNLRVVLGVTGKAGWDDNGSYTWRCCMNQLEFKV